MLALCLVGILAVISQTVADWSRVPFRDGGLVVIGGATETGNHTSSMETYDFATSKWTRRKDLPRRLHNAAAASLDGKIYITGGISDNWTTLADTFIYDPLTSSWSSAPQMTTRRTKHVLVAFGGELYAIGGVDEEDKAEDNFLGWIEQLTLTEQVDLKRFRDVEKYNPKRRSWRPLKSMCAMRSKFAAGVLDGLLYAVGGEGEDRILRSAEVYDPKTGLWSPIKSMTNRRAGHCVAVSNGKLYAIGGLGEGVYHDSVEVYNPKKDEWKTVAKMPTAREGAGAVAYKGLIYVIGGTRGNFTLLDSVDVYDVTSDTWTTLDDRMSSGRLWAGVALISESSSFYISAWLVIFTAGVNFVASY